jgi:MoaA/NifB/PqqE/SkfB family radical SAM enzyme
MQLKDRIPLEKMREICADIVSMGVKAVTFTGGGEPLLYQGLPEAIRSLAKGGVQVAALTNGALLKGDAAKALADHGAWVRVSMDGWDGPSYSESRHVGLDEFDKVMANLAAFSKLGSRCRLSVSFIVSRANAEHIADYCKLAKDCGVRTVKLSACVVSNSGRENNAYHGAIMGTVRHQIAKARELVDESFELVDHYHEADERFDKDYRTCPFARLLTVIAADQSVYTCQDKAYNEKGLLGSIKDRRFKDFWFSEENKKALAAIDPSVMCRHHCVAHTKNKLLVDYLALDPDHAAFV